MYKHVTVRLVNGPTIYEGRVEVYYAGQWGTVCDNGWSLNDARVVCTQLSLGRATSAVSRAYYGQGSGRIWITSVSCRGNELGIERCPHSGWGVHSCTHSEDAGVRCTTLSPTTGMLASYSQSANMM